MDAKVSYENATARRRLIIIDPAESNDEVELPNARPWHVAASLEEAVEYALTEEYWDCVEEGLTPLFLKPKGTVELGG
jgi:hypothetical protein